MESVYEFGDYVAFLKEGKIEWYGDAKKINKSKKQVLRILLMVLMKKNNCHV